MDVPETRFVKTNDGVRLAYKTFGDGPVDFHGTVVRNPKLDEPQGGSPPLPKSVTGGNSGRNNGPPAPVAIDGGTWSGHRFFSSGLISPGSLAVYSLRFSKAGTYRFACLVHPLKVGTLVVTP